MNRYFLVALSFFSFLFPLSLLSQEDPFADVFADDGDIDSRAEAERVSDVDPFADIFAEEESSDADSIDIEEKDENNGEGGAPLPAPPDIKDGADVESADSIDDDLDALFEGEDDLVVEYDESTQDENPSDVLLKSDKLEWGGKFRTELDFRFQWDDYMNEPGRLHDRTFVDPFLEAYLFFDARPKTNYRIFGKFVIKTDNGTTFSQLESTLGFNPEDASIVSNGDGTFSVGLNSKEDGEESSFNELNRIEPTGTTLTFGVQELFADFNWNDTLYFRIGKSFVKWGVGYFFSPADVINTDMIDFEDPTEDRSGPMYFRMHYPFKEHNLYLYLLTEGVAEIEDVGFALNMEFLAGKTEITTGAYYQIKHAPKFTFTVSAPIDDVKLFAEGVLSFGSDRVFVRPSKNQPEPDVDEDGNAVMPYHTLDTYTLGYKPVFSGTAGLLYMNMDYGITLVGQYYFNGEGYKKFSFDDGTSLLDSAARLLQNPNSNGLYKPPDSRPTGYLDPANIELGDLTFFGQHYLALSFMANDIEDSGVSLWTYWVGAMSDLSGIYSFEVSYDIMKYINIATGFRLSYGAVGTEFSDPMALYLQADSNLQEPTADFYITCRIGAGNF